MTRIFDQINERDKVKLLKILEAFTYDFSKNNKILSTIKDDNIIGIIAKGYIQITKVDENGNKVIIEELEEDDIFGTNITSLKISEYDITTKEDTRLIIIDYDILLDNYQNTKPYYQQFIKNLLEITMSKIKEKNERIEILTKKTIRNKLLEYFNITSKKVGSKYIYLPFTFTDLADYLAVDRCAMSREIKYLKEEGFIEVKGRKITLLYDKFSSIYI